MGYHDTSNIIRTSSRSPTQLPGRSRGEQATLGATGAAPASHTASVPLLMGGEHSAFRPATMPSVSASASASASVSAALALNIARQYLWRHMAATPQTQQQLQQHRLPVEQDEEDEINVDAETETEADETEAN